MCGLEPTPDALREYARLAAMHTLIGTGLVVEDERDRDRDLAHQGTPSRSSARSAAFHLFIMACDALGVMSIPSPS
jgi:hypothetical protein